MKEIDKMIKVMQAFADGEKIEEYYGDWYDTLTPSWNWADFNYRIKPDTWKCTECKQEQTIEGACISKYTNGSYCSLLCADISDFKFMMEKCK